MKSKLLRVFWDGGKRLHLHSVMTRNAGILMRTAVRTSYFAMKCEYMKPAFGPCENHEHGVTSVQHSRTVWNIPWSMYKWTWFVTWGCHRATHKATLSGLKAYFTARNKNPCRYILATSTWALDIQLPFCAPFNETSLAWCEKSTVVSLSASFLCIFKNISFDLLKNATVNIQQQERRR